jgi:hypothetical protein
MKRRFESDEEYEDYLWSKRRCTCNVGWNWENGPCDYCTDDRCEDCRHESGSCPDDCYCGCNDNVDPEDEDPDNQEC